MADDLPDAPWVTGGGGNELPDAPWIKAPQPSPSSIPFVGSARDWAQSRINPSEPHGTSIFGTPISKTPDTYSGTVGQYAKEALRDVGKGWSGLMEATDPRRTTPSPIGTPAALAKMAGGLGRAAISPATALVNPAWEKFTGIPGEKAGEAVMGGLAPEGGMGAVGQVLGKVPAVSTLATRTAPERGSALTIPGTLQRQGQVDLGALERDIAQPAAQPAARPGTVAPETVEATPRENGVRLLPHDVPHDAAPRGRASVGAAGAEADALAEYSPATVKAARDLLAESGLDNPHQLEARLDEISPHHMFAELSPALEHETSGVAAADKGQARNLIAQSLLERRNEAPQRMSSVFDRTVAQRQNVTELRQAIEAERAKQASPLWQQFTQTPVPPTPELRALLPRLDAAGALRAANKAMREEGLPVQQGFARAVTNEAGEFAQEVEHMPTAAAFQYAKEYLDGLIEKSLAMPGEAKAARRYTQLKNDLVAAIDNHPDPNVAGLWQAARRAWEEPTQLLSAQKLGARLLTQHISPEDVPGLIEGFSPERMENLRIGLRGYLASLEKANRDPARTSNRLMDAVLAPGAQEKLRAVLEGDKADQLIGAIQHEDAMHGAPNRIIGGSPTAGRQAARDRYTAAGEGPIGKGISRVAGYLRHPIRAGAADLVEAGANRLASRQEQAMSQLRDELSRIMTTQGPERNAIARALIGSEEPAASAWARPGGAPSIGAPPVAGVPAARGTAQGANPAGWRPMAPGEAHGAPPAAGARPEKQPAATKSPSLLQFLASKGGIKRTGDLAHTLDKNPFVPGRGRLFRAGGMSEEDAMQAAVEAGYLDTEEGIRGRGNIRDFHDAVHEEAHGRKRYPIGEERAAAAADPGERSHQVESAVLDHFEQYGGVTPNSQMRDRVVELVEKHHMGVDEAHERAAMEEHYAGQDEGIPPLPKKPTQHLSNESGGTLPSGVQAPANQKQPQSGGAGQASRLPGAAHQEGTQRGPGVLAGRLGQQEAGVTTHSVSAEQFEGMLNKAKRDVAANKARAEELASTGKNSIRFYHSSGRTALAGPDMSKPGKWRLTYIDADKRPSGHTEFGSFKEAIARALEDHFDTERHPIDDIPFRRGGRVKRASGGRAEGGDVFQDPDQDSALASSMTHWPEGPNPIEPYLQGTKDFLRGGISQVLRGQGVELPDWSNRISDVAQSEGFNTAIGMATPLGSLPQRIAALEQSLGRKLRPDLTEAQVAALEKSGAVNFKSAKKAYDPASQAYIPGQELKGVKDFPDLGLERFERVPSEPSEVEKAIRRFDLGIGSRGDEKLLKQYGLRGLGDIQGVPTVTGAGTVRSAQPPPAAANANISGLREEAQRLSEQLRQLNNAPGDFNKSLADRLHARLSEIVKQIGPLDEPLQRDVIARGRSGRPTQTAPLPIGNEDAILGKGAKLNEPPAPANVNTTAADRAALQQHKDRLYELLSNEISTRKATGADLTRPSPLERRIGSQIDEVTKRLKDMGPEPPEPSITAYQGSPHDFDKFDFSKIGTGEGSQAYGYGLYFAESEGVARDYRNRLAGGDIDKVRPDAEAIASIQPQWDAVVAKLRAAHEKSGGRMTDETAALQNHLDALNDHAVADTLARKPYLKEGRMYQVNIKADPEHFLDWDRPLSEQSEHVKKILKPLNLKDTERGEWMHHEFYQRFGGNTPEAQMKGGQALRSAGIPGIKYLDQKSRGDFDLLDLKRARAYWEKNPDSPDAAQRIKEIDQAIKEEENKPRTRNFVVFDDKLIDIMKKYGLAGLSALPAMGAYHYQDKDIPQGRARGGRVPGELTESNKHSHAEVGYVSVSPRKKQRCDLCWKFIPDGPACLKVQSPIAAAGWCRRFSRTKP